MAEHTDRSDDLDVRPSQDRPASSHDTQSSGSPPSDRVDQPQKQSLYQRTRDSVLALWWFEILASCFSITCIACMIALLCSIHGQPYEPWNAFGASITPNTILAILSTFSKSSLLLAVAEALGQLKWIYFQQRAHRLLDLQIFDDASRGPLGALKLMWTVKFQAIVASIGAVIVVLAMAMDPFTQQILSFPTAATNLTNSTAQIAAAHGFGLNYASYDVGEVTIRYYTQLQDAVTFGILSSDFTPTHFQCSTGNCRWPPFRTLGVCNKCIDVTPQLDVKCHFNPRLGESHDKWCVYTFPKREGTMDEYRTSDPPFRATYYWVMNARGNVSSWTSLNKSLRIQPALQTMHNKVTGDYLLPLIAVVEQIRWSGATDYEIANVSTWEHISQTIHPKAIQCYLHWCEQTHGSTSVGANVLKDIPTSTTSLRVSFSHGGKVTKHPFSDQIFPLWPVNRPQPAESALNASQHHHEFRGVYWIDYADHIDLGRCVSKTLSSAAKALEDTVSYWSYYDHSAISTRIFYGNLSLILDQVATSLSGTVRNLNRTRTIYGNVAQPVTHVAVNWYWLIYPATLVLLAALFVIVSIRFSAERDGTVWKTSVLPWIFCRLCEGEQRDADASGLRELEHTARNTRAQLTEREGGGQALRIQPTQSGDG